MATLKESIRRVREKGMIAERIRDLPKREYDELRENISRMIRNILPLSEQDVVLNNLDLIRDGKSTRFMGADATRIEEECNSFLEMRDKVS